MKNTIAIIAVALLLLAPARAFSQGSVFGSVINSDMSVPANGEILMVGFLGDTDEEIHIETSIGAGYDNGHWFDDFQNYQSATAGNPYDYYFFNSANGERAHLAALIPDNSFQQEDVALASANWPLSPTGLSAVTASDSTALVKWRYLPGLSYHVYRREATSQGSFFRIDDPLGALGAGVTDSSFLDATISPTILYTYAVIAVDSSGAFSPATTIGLDEPPVSCCIGVRGDYNNDGDDANVLDLTFLIDDIFRGGPAAECDEEADIDADGSPSTIIDLTYLVDLIFRGGPDPEPC
jgi:hypothetical protein